MSPLNRCSILLACLAVCLVGAPQPPSTQAADTGPSPGGGDAPKTLRILFIGNSFTARHWMPKMVVALAEEGNLGLSVEFTQVIYGGRTLAEHWQLGTPNYVRLHSLSHEEELATVASLSMRLNEDPGDSHAKKAIGKHLQLLNQLGSTTDKASQRQKWDVVVLQSYKDDADGEDSLYAEYATKFAALAQAQGARVILYETAPDALNAEALKSTPDPRPVMEKERDFAALADRLDAAVAPMPLITLKCQTERPDIPLRFVNDFHLNHRMSYLTACAIYAALFDRSPEGLALNSVTDTSPLSDEEADKDKDGKPLTQVLSDADRADLQRIAWQGCLEFGKLRDQ